MVFLLKYSNLRIFLTQKKLSSHHNCHHLKKNIGAGYFIITLSARYYGTTETSSLQHHPSDPVQSRGIRTILAIQQAAESRYEKSCESQILN